MRWSRPLLLAKSRALGVHLLLSLLLVAIALALMWFVWFPAPLFFTDGGGIGLKLLLLVDLVLGPLLTFVVFQPSKPRRTIAFDLGVIAALQLAAYGAGLWSIHSVRVQAVAFHEGVFHAVNVQAFEDQDITPASWAALGRSAPYLVDVREPAAGDEQAGVMMFGFTAGLEPYQLQFLYRPLASVWPGAVAAAGLDLAALRSRDAALAAKAERWLGRHAGLDRERVRFYRVEGFYDSAVLVLDDAGRWRGGFAGELKASSASPRS